MNSISVIAKKSRNTISFLVFFLFAGRLLTSVYGYLEICRSEGYDVINEEKHEKI